jgi:hypothetical protein
MLRETSQTRVSEFVIGFDAVALPYGEPGSEQRIRERVSSLAFRSLPTCREAVYWGRDRNTVILAISLVTERTAADLPFLLEGTEDFLLVGECVPTCPHSEWNVVGYRYADFGLKPIGEFFLQVSDALENPVNEPEAVLIGIYQIDVERQAEADRVLESLKSAFNLFSGTFESANPLYIDAIYLSSRRTEDAIPWLGQLLIRSVETIRTNAGVQSESVDLLLRFSVASQFASHSATLAGAEKVSARHLVEIISELDVAQREAVIGWFDFVARFSRATGFFEDEVSEADLTYILRWLSTFAEVQKP